MISLDVVKAVCFQQYVDTAHLQHVLDTQATATAT